VKLLWFLGVWTKTLTIFGTKIKILVLSPGYTTHVGCSIFIFKEYSRRISTYLVVLYLFLKNIREEYLLPGGFIFILGKIP
jgi:hypothetical protein